MKNYNSAIISGVMASDFKLTYSNNNAIAIGRFSVAHNYKDNKGTDKVSFFDCVCFGTMAKVANDNLKKGKRVFVQGELKQENYTDNQGVKKSFVRIYADIVTWDFEEPKKEEYKPKNDDRLEPVTLETEGEIPF